MSKAASKRVIKVFIASPGGLEVERRAFKDLTDALNKGFGDGLNVRFEPLAWEDRMPQAGVRLQGEFNEEVNACHVFLLVLDKRWGREAADATIHAVKCLPKLGTLQRSYTMEEFSLAVARWERTGAPAVHVFSKRPPADAAADPGPQLSQVLAFRQMAADSGRVLLNDWGTIDEFTAKLDGILREHARNDDDGGGPPVAAPKGILPEFGGEFKKQIEALRKELTRTKERLRKLERSGAGKKGQHTPAAKRANAKALAARNSAEIDHAKRETSLLALAEGAAKAALDGRIEEARQDFAKALDGTTNIGVLSLGYRFFERIGELDEAERLLRRWLSISGPDKESLETAAAYGNLGIIEKTRGNLEAAETYHNKSLTINKKLGRLEGMASNYGNLAVIEQTRGNPNAAKAHAKNALAIYERLGLQEGMAIQNGNLSIFERACGNLEAAITCCKKALAIDESLGRQEGMAANYGNLGLIERTRGNLDEAKSHFEKALAIYRPLERLEGMAIAYGNLGIIAKDRGQTDETRRLWTLARDLYRKIGAKLAEAKVQGWLDGLPT